MNIPIGPIDLLIIQGSPFCNIDCKYCYLPDRLDKKRISLDTVEAAVKKVFDEKLVRKEFALVWHAGEPTAVPLEFYKSVYEILKRIVPENFKVIQHIQTNATLLTQAWCDFIKEADIRVGISIDGPKFLHDHNRITRSGKGTFDIAMAGVELLKKNNIRFSNIAVLTAKSLDFPIEIYEFFKELAPYSLGFNIDEEDGANTISTIQSEHEQKLRTFWKIMYEMQLQEGNYIHIREIFGFNEMLLNANFDIEENYSGHMLCPLKIITMDINGDFTTFSPELIGMRDERFGNFVLGNIHKDGFRSSLEKDKFKLIFDEISEGISLCKNTCDYFKQCGGGAPSNKLYENKSFATTETKYCKYSKKVIIDSILEVIEDAFPQ